MNIDHNRGAYGSKIAYEQLNSRRVDDDKVAAFLLSPRYRVHRHLLLQTVILLITINVFLVRTSTASLFLATIWRILILLSYHQCDHVHKFVCVGSSFSPEESPR